MADDAKSTPKPKSLAITMILAIVLGGIGHVYLGFVKKGLIIFIIGIGLGIGLYYLFGFWGTLATLAFYIWQIFDAYKTCKRLYP